MSYSSQFLHIPGAYHFDAPSPNGPALSASIFRPPAGGGGGGGSPSASSSVCFNLAKSTGSLYNSDAQQPLPPQTPLGAGAAAYKRKRNVASGRLTRESTPLQDWTSMNVDGDDAYNTNHRYTLAGQIETPTGNGPLKDPMAMEDSVYSDIDYRRALGSKRRHDEMEDRPPPPSFSGGTSGSPFPASGGWSAFAVSTIGGVVGKVWEFCKTGAFRGFKAGGGAAYPATQQTTTTSNDSGFRNLSSPPPENYFASATPATAATNRFAGNNNGRVWCNEHDIPTLQQDDGPVLDSSTAFSNAFASPPPPMNLFGTRMATAPERSGSPDSARPAAKRRQVRESAGGGGEELRRNWVMVDDRSPFNKPSINHRPASRASTRLSLHQPLPKQPPQQPPRYATSTASSAGRRISVPVSRLNTNHASSPSPNFARRSSSRVSHAGAASLTAREPASFARPRSPITTTTFTPLISPPSRIPMPTTGAASPSPTIARPSSRQSPTRTLPSHLSSLSGGIGIGAGGSLRGTPSSSSHRRIHSSSAASSSPRRRKASMPAILHSLRPGIPTDDEEDDTDNHDDVDVNADNHDVGAGANHHNNHHNNHKHQVSNASASSIAEDSPRLDAEAKRLAARKLAEERDADARMEAFNAQLRQMIREGKEALGTRVTVEIGDIDAGGLGTGMGMSRSAAGAWVDYDDEDI